MRLWQIEPVKYVFFPAWLLLMLSCCHKQQVQPSYCQESVEPMSFGFGARCAIGATMIYVAQVDGGMRFDEANPWAGGYIVCRCPE
jgi:hypothetical protein